MSAERPEVIVPEGFWFPDFVDICGEALFPNTWHNENPKKKLQIYNYLVLFLDGWLEAFSIDTEGNKNNLDISLFRLSKQDDAFGKGTVPEEFKKWIYIDENSANALFESEKWKNLAAKTLEIRWREISFRKLFGKKLKPPSNIDDVIKIFVQEVTNSGYVANRDLMRKYIKKKTGYDLADDAKTYWAQKIPETIKSKKGRRSINSKPFFTVTD